MPDKIRIQSKITSHAARFNSGVTFFNGRGHKRDDTGTNLEMPVAKPGAVPQPESCQRSWSSGPESFHIPKHGLRSSLDE